MEAVITKDEIAATPSPSGPPEDWSLIQRVRANFDPSRSGDFYVALKRYVTPIPNTSFGYVATHGSPWGYDRRVPILFWWNGVAPYEQPNGKLRLKRKPPAAPVFAGATELLHHSPPFLQPALMRALDFAH